MIQKVMRIQSKITGRTGQVLDTRVNIVNRPGWMEQVWVQWDDGKPPRWVFSSHLTSATHLAENGQRPSDPT
jgi:hypothetical protein